MVVELLLLVAYALALQLAMERLLGESPDVRDALRGVPSVSRGANLRFRAGARRRGVPRLG